MSCSVGRRLLSLGVCSLSMLLLLPVALSDSVTPLSNHGGRLLTGNLNVGIIWYGPIPRAQRKAILSFFRALNGPDSAGGKEPHVSSWWNIVASYQPGAAKLPVKVLTQVSDENYSYGKVLIKDFIKPLLPKATGGNPQTLAVIIASKGVTVQDMCAGSCAQHGLIDNQYYVAVGDPEEECPECAWPFLASHGKVGKTLLPPNGNVGADSMVKLLAGGLAGVVTNPFGDGFYATGHGGHLLEATSTCPDVFASGKLLVDPQNGGSYNAVGDEGIKYLLPPIWNPKTSTCWTPL